MDGSIIIGTDLDTKSFDKQIQNLEYELEQVEYELSHKKELNLDSRTIEEYEAKSEKLKNKIIDLKQKQDDLSKTSLSGMQNSIDNIGNSISNVITKVTSWGIALFGIRTAYNFIQQSIGILSQSNKQIGTDIDYIKFALASTLQPVVEGLIKLVYKLLTYVAYIAKAWFGVNIFANASTKAFENANKSVKNTNKSAKELQKTLTGFDEMNVLQKNGSVASGGGGGGVETPSVDLSDIQNVKIPGWVDWIAKNKDTILKFFKQLALLIAGIKMAQFLSSLSGVGKVLSNIIKVLSGLSQLNLLLALTGIAVAITGIIKLVEGIIGFIKDPSWSNFTNILKGLSLTLIGISITLLAINSSNPLGWITAGVGIVTGLISVFGKLFTANEKNTKELKNSAQATKELKQAQQELAEQTSAYTSAVKDAEQKEKALSDAEKKHKMSGEELFNAVSIGTLKYTNMSKAQREVFDAYNMNLEAQSKLEEETRKFTKTKEQLNQKSAELSGAVYTETGKFNEYFQTLLDGYKKGEVGAEVFSNSIYDMFGNMDSKAKETFVKNLPQDIKDGVKLGNANFLNLGDAIIFEIAKIQSKGKKTFETEIPNSISKSLDINKYQKSANKITSLFAGIGSAIAGISTEITVTTSKSSSSKKSKNAKGAIYLPRLAVGGIINMPGRGIPLGTAIGGERGAEGVIPLTDSQQMSLLGEAIGKYINLNATIPIYVGNRQIAREIKKINMQQEYATNS